MTSSIDETAAVEATWLGRRATRGAVALVVRQAVGAFVSVGSGVALARLLTPSDFGVYAIVAFLFALLLAFGDAGLGASLVRQSEDPTPRQLAVVFTGQQVLVLLLASAGWLAAPSLVGLYGLHDRYVWLFRLAAAAFVVTSLKVIPTVGVERQLAFERLGLVGLVESVVFAVTAVAFAVIRHDAASLRPPEVGLSRAVNAEGRGWRR